MFYQLLAKTLLIDIVKHTNLYDRQKNKHIFHVNLNEIKSFLWILIIYGYHPIPRQYVYWETAMDSGADIVKEAMP